MPKPETLSPADVAARLGCSVQAVYRRLRDPRAVRRAGATFHGEGRRGVWRVPNTRAALVALTPASRGRPKRAAGGGSAPSKSVRSGRGK